MNCRRRCCATRERAATPTARVASHSQRVRVRTSGAIGTVHHRSRDPDPRQYPTTFEVKQIQLIVKYVFRVSFNVRSNVSVRGAARHVAGSGTRPGMYHVDPALRRSAAPAALTERHSCELCFVRRKPKVKTLEETAPTSHSSFSVP